MNRRRPVKSLTGDDVRTLEHLWIVSLRRGYPLNVLVTVHFDGFDALAPAKKACANRRILDNIGEFLRRISLPIYNLWVREIDVGDEGEHLHILVHIPANEFARFKRCALLWAKSGEIDVRRAHYRTGKARDGKKHSVLLYVAKQMSPKASFATAWRRVRGGTIIGQRWGCSRSLSAEKRAHLEWLKVRRRLNRERFGR